MEAERRLQISVHPQKKLRRAALAVHDVVVRHPMAAAHKLGVNLRALRDVELLGVGFDSVVLKHSNEEVVKVHFMTALHSAIEQKQLLDQRKAEHSAMAEYLSGLVLPQTSFVGTHALMPDRPVTQTKQPYVDTHDPALFIPTTSTVKPTALHALRTNYPNAYAQLPLFIEQSRTLYADKHVIPDTLGASNLAVDTTSGDFVMIDGQPMTMLNMPGQILSLQRLDTLEQALSDVA